MTAPSAVGPLSTDSAAVSTRRDIAQVLQLPDGRALAWREYGDPKGLPCVYTTGTPASGLAGKPYDQEALQAGVRWISVDKPGYGLSDLQPRRQLLDWPDDVAVLADHLGLERFAVAGESGGGPHALALAYKLSARITTAVVVAGMGPGDDPSVRDGMKRSNQILFGLARRAPWALWFPLAIMGRALTDPRRASQYMAKQIAAAPVVDRVIFEEPEFAAIGLASHADAFRRGPRGAISEMRIFGRPWGFRIEDITTHVDLFHGEQDVNVPVAVARSIARALPDCDARFFPDHGHAVGHPQVKEILACVTAAG